MAKLITLKTWVEERFEDLPLRTAQDWAKKGEIPGVKKIGKKWFIDPDMEKATTGNDLVDSILLGS